MILARHLAAAKLNAAALGDAGAETWIDIADALLASVPGELPNHVSSSSVQGRMMFILAATLEAYGHRCGRKTPHAALMSPTGLVGDVDEDCSVSMFDLRQIARGFGSSRGDQRYEGKSDLNDNGSIDISDIQIAGTRFTERC